MDTQFPKLTKDQWNFLAVLHALEKPVSLDVAGKLSPLLPAPFLELLGRKNTRKIIQEDDFNRVFLYVPPPAGLIEKLKTLNGKDQLSGLIDRLYEMNLIDQIDPAVISKLLAETGRSKDIAELEIRQARKALKNKDQYQAMQHLWNVVRQLYEMIDDTKYDHLFISASLKSS
jgi:hypothetical protein